MTEPNDLWDEIAAAGPPEHYFLGTHMKAAMAAFRDAYSFAVPSPAAVAQIAAFVEGRRLLEIGAGSGLWARLLQDEGVAVTATDDFSWAQPEAIVRPCSACVGALDPACMSCGGAGMERVIPELLPGWEIPWSKFTDVERIDAAEAVAKYAGHAALLFCWPPNGTPMATNALRAFTGDRVVYIGEGEGGATADREFHTLLARDWDEVEHGVALPQWPFTRDRLFLYARRPAIDPAGNAD